MSTIEANPFTEWSAADYIKLPPIPLRWKFADVGPGTHPHPRADVYIDHDPEKLAPLKQAGKEVIVAALQNGLPDVPNNAYDFVWCSHVLEHCVELQKCVDTLNRISKRGCAVMPSFVKDALMFFEEREHFWHVLPNPTHGEPPIFVERNHGFVERLRDSTMQKAMCFLLRTGSQHDCTAEQYMRGWYQRSEPILDVVAHWDEQHPLKVIALR